MVRRTAIRTTVAMLAVAAMLTGAAQARANTLVTVTIPAAHGEVASKWLNYTGAPKADIILPTGYNARKAYPLLVFLHGLSGSYEQLQEFTPPMTTQLAGLDAIVVFPEGGNGWYTNWWNDGERGGPAWEDYELDEVLPYVRDHYRILSGRRYHAIAGISMGGLGATFLGGRLPGFFGSVVSLSGFVDPQYDSGLTQQGMGLLAYAPLQGDHDSYPVYGPPTGFYANGHNPAKLAVNLKQTRVFETNGTGVPNSSELSQPFTGPTGAISTPEGSILEAAFIQPMNAAFHAALLGAGVNVTYSQHTGGHDEPNFDNEIKAMLAWGLFKPVVTNPASWENETVATSGQLWDISYTFTEPPDAIVTFTRNRRSLSITAAGSSVTITTGRGCTVTTPTPATITVPVRRCS